MDFDEMLRRLVEENKDKIGVVGLCPNCGGIVGYNWINKCFKCMDCNDFTIDDINEIEHWRIDSAGREE